MLSEQQLIDLVLASFEAEKNKDPETNAKLLHQEFAVTDMVKAKANNLPRLEGDKLRELIDAAFKIEGREFIFNRVAADVEKQLVFVEFVESYPDPKTGQLYRTPQVAVCEIKAGKLYRTRHYMDPRLSFENLDQTAIDEAFS